MESRVWHNVLVTLPAVPPQTSLTRALDGASIKDSIHAPIAGGPGAVLPQKAAYIPPHLREKMQQSRLSPAAKYSSPVRGTFVLTRSDVAPRPTGWGNPEARPFQPRATPLSSWDSPAAPRRDDWNLPR